MRVCALVGLCVWAVGCGQDVDRGQYSTAEELGTQSDNEREVVVAPGENAAAAAPSADVVSETVDAAAREEMSTSGEPASESGDGSAAVAAEVDGDASQRPMVAEQTADGAGLPVAGSQATETSKGDGSVTAPTAAVDGAPAAPNGERFPAAYYEKPKWVSEGPEGAARVSYDDLDLLKLMNLDPVPEGVGAELPDRITSLDGKRIRLRGFMFPPFAPDGLKGFVFARDNEICCFGRSPKIYDIIPVELREGVTTRYIEGRPFDVVGVMHVDPDIELFQLFYIDDAIVIE